MPYIISEACIDIMDNSCIQVCPVDCISAHGRMRVIDPESCIDCGACVPECPVEAIYPDDELPDALSEFVQINAAVLEGTEQVDALVDAYASAHNVSNTPAEGK
nr:ferredoxin family protein [Rhodococcus sp. (in: high G+C Gram-positive bacteria)]